MMMVQEDLNFLSLRDEVKSFLYKFEITDVTQFSKKRWKHFVNKSIRELNRLSLLEDLKSYKKVDFWSVSIEDFGMKDYFLKLNLSDSRLKFRARAQTMYECATSYQMTHKTSETCSSAEKGVNL